MNDYKASFRRNFLAGLLIILPLWLTLFIIWLVFRWISSFTSPFLSPFFHLLFGAQQSEFLVRITSFFIAILVIWAVGLFATHIVGRRILLGVENVFLRLPVLRDIYTAMRKFIQQFTLKRSCRKVVLLEFPRKGLYSIGFVTCESMAEVHWTTKGSITSVFVPTTPNPSTGFFLMVPEEELITLDVDVDEAFKLIVSGGIMHPDKRITVKHPSAQE